MNNKTLTYIFGLTAVIASLLIAIKFNQGQFNEFPGRIHAWVQTDHYALALGFIENKGDFFHPETYCLNKLFPSENPSANPSGITPVDFPIHNYIVSLLMRLFNTTDPWVFKSYVLFYSLIGLFFLFLAVSFLTKDNFKAFIIIAFIILSPVHAYYQYGFIPSITSLSSFFIGIYFLLRYFQFPEKKLFYLSILFLTLAALSRFSFTVFYIALASQRFLTYLLKRKIDWRELLTLAIGIAMISGYFLYNQYLKNEYGTLFLSKPLPPSNIQELFENIRISWSRWKTEYLTIYHYLILALLLLLATISILINQAPRKIKIPDLLQLTLIFLAGMIPFTIMISMQFKDHDYYFLDTFFPLVILFAIWLLSELDLKKRLFSLVTSGILLSLIIMAGFTSLKTLEKRREPVLWDKVTPLNTNYRNGKTYLDNLKIPPDARILIPGTSSPNNALIHLDRKGYSIRKTNRASLIDAFQFDFDYVVKQDALLYEVLDEYPEFKEEYYRLAGNGKLSIYQKGVKQSTRSELDLLGFINIDTLQLGQKDSIIEISPSMEFQNFIKCSVGEILNDDFYGFMFQTDWKTAEDTEAAFYIVSSISENGETIYYKDYPVKISSGGSWVSNQYIFLPGKIDNPDAEIKLYIWNPSKTSLSVSNPLAIYGNRIIL